MNIERFSDDRRSERDGMHFPRDIGKTGQTILSTICAILSTVNT
jgi:hypothetical protein